MSSSLSLSNDEGTGESSVESDDGESRTFLSGLQHKSHCWSSMQLQFGRVAENIAVVLSDLKRGNSLVVVL
ncbi:hypothetical protein TB2_034741 [Malus domestica]